MHKVKLGLNSDWFFFSLLGAGKLCFGVRLGCISKPDQTMQTKTMKHVETFLDCFGNQFYVMPWYKLFRSPFYQKYAKSADYLKRYARKKSLLKQPQNII